jgi:hypothetical protein
VNESEGTGKVIRALFFTIWAALGSVTGAQAGPCDLQDQLLRAHHLAQVFRQHRGSEQEAATAQQLGAALDHIPISDLAPRLHAAGLAPHQPTVLGFLRTQRALVNAQALWGNTRNISARLERSANDFSQQMQPLIPKLACTQTRSDLPDGALPVTGKTTPTGIVPGQVPVRPQARQATAISMGVFSFIAVLMGGSMLLRALARRKRRRDHRRPCALSCTLRLPPPGPPAEWNGRICDLSQTGAKIWVEGALPDDTHAFQLRSHDWESPARISWRNGPWIGITFASLLTQQELLWLLRLNRKLHSAQVRTAQTNAPPPTKNGTPQDAVF